MCFKKVTAGNIDIYILHTLKIFIHIYYQQAVTSKIIFLGTGGDAYVVGKQYLGSGGIIVQCDGLQIHIDPGPGALVRAREENINLRENMAVLVSSSNLLFANDVNAVIHAMTYGGFDVKGVLVGSGDYINSKDNKQLGLLETHRNFVEKILPLKEGQKMAIENIEIRALKTYNSGLGFKLFTPHFILAYSGPAVYNKDLAKEYEQADILILHVQNPIGTKGDLLNTDDAIAIIKKAKPQLTIITGFGKKMVEADPLDEARTIQKATGVQVICAKEGLKINPSSYSAILQQKTLNLYRKP